MDRPIPSFKTLLWRGWRKKCPQCGEGALYRGWFKLHDRCPVCGLRYLPDPGDLLGPLVFLDRILFLIPFVVIFYFRLWHPSMVLFILSGGGMIGVLVFTMPNRNGVSLAFDYYLRRSGGELLDQDSRTTTPAHQAAPSREPGTASVPLANQGEDHHDRHAGLQ